VCLPWSGGKTKIPSVLGLIEWMMGNAYNSGNLALGSHLARS
jgi:hypothetical protein